MENRRILKMITNLLEVLNKSSQRYQFLGYTMQHSILRLNLSAASYQVLSVSCTHKDVYCFRKDFIISYLDPKHGDGARSSGSTVLLITHGLPGGNLLNTWIMLGWAMFHV